MLAIIDIKDDLGPRDLYFDQGPDLRAKSKSGEGHYPRLVAHCEFHPEGLRAIEKREVEILRDREERGLQVWTIETQGVEKHLKDEAIWAGELHDLLRCEVLLPQFEVAVDSEDGIRQGCAVAHCFWLTRHIELKVSSFDAWSVVKGV